METKKKSHPPHGVFFVGVPSASRKTADWKAPAVTGIFLLCLVSATSALGQATPPVRQPGAEKSEIVELEEISVTGSHIRMSTTEADKGALPIELISEAKFQLTSGERISDFVRSSPVINATAPLPTRATGGALVERA